MVMVDKLNKNQQDFHGLIVDAGAGDYIEVSGDAGTLAKAMRPYPQYY